MRSTSSSHQGTSTIAVFGRQFKNICDQLATIGHVVDESDKTHWFLCGLGYSFETFSTTICASCAPYDFRDSLAQAEGHEIVLKSIHGSAPTPVAFFDNP